MVFDPATLLSIGSGLLGGGGGSTTNTSQSTLTNSLNFSPINSIGGSVGQGPSDARANPLITAATDNTPAQQSNPFGSVGVGGGAELFNPPAQAGLPLGLIGVGVVGSGLLLFLLRKGA